MKLNLKRVLMTLALLGILLALSLGAFSAAASSDDPAEGYVPTAAANEDAGLKLWFEHSFKKVLTKDTTPSDMDTYSVYMAKNEIENCQFVLYSDTTKAGMSATVTSFTDKDGNEIPAEIYYQMYVTVSDVKLGNLFGQTDSSEEIIREGETPDPVYPLAKIGGRFQLNGGKSQAFFIKLRTEEETPSGWYSATLDIKNSAGEVVKTRKVFCYVWDFEISEKTALKTSFVTSNDKTYGGSYQKFYDYLLENRLMATDIPGKLTPDNPYLSNPRVSAIRVAGYIEAGENPGSLYDDKAIHYSYYTDIYNRLRSSDVWDEVKDKLYFYDTDEPLPLELIVNGSRDSVEEAYTSREGIDKYWGGEKPRIVIPHGEDHPYPYYTFTNEVKPLQSFSPSVLSDAEEAMLKDNLCTVWCPRMYGFTPMSEIAKTDYKGLETSIIRTNSGPYSGNISKVGLDYYIWENIYGEFTDRVKSEMALDEEDIELWAYSAGFNKGYTYANHLIENTGLQTKMMFWQLYQEDCTGYLYYATNNWSEQDGNQTTSFADSTVTGGNIKCQWKTNKWYLSSTGKYIYGNGVLFYGASQAMMRGVTDYVGSLRVELMRDGVEEYQMLTMIEDYLGEGAAKAFVGSVSDSVVSYLSLPTFQTSAWGADMDEYDIMATVRRSMGDTLEAAVVAGKCDHKWDGGKVTKEATCLEIGYTTYTCTDCGAERDEYIPALHSEGSCFEVVSSTVSCTNDGTVVSKCKVCGFEKIRSVSAYHSDEDYYKYEAKNEKVHNVVCTLCGEELDNVAHSSFFVKTDATCTDGGEEGYACKDCGYGNKSVTEALGHEYADGECVRCGEADPDATPPEAEVIRGDLNGDGKVNSIDTNVMKRLMSGASTGSDEQNKAADVNGDGKVNSYDTNRLKRYIAGQIDEL